MQLDRLHTPTLLPLFLIPVGALAVASGSSEEALSFAPTPGTETTKVFQETTALTLETAQMLVGEDVSPMDQLKIDLGQTRRVTVTDVYTASKNDVPHALTRTFDAIETGIAMNLVDPDGDETAEIKGQHPLIQEKVKFTWDDNEGAALPSFIESDEGHEDWLEGLTADMDLCALLVPTEDGAIRAKGERWLVDPAAFLALTRPGGLGHVVAPIPEAQAGAGLFMTALASVRDSFGEPTGAVEMWWKSCRQINGEKCAILELEVNMEGTADLSQLAFQVLLPSMPQIQEEYDFAAFMLAEVSLKGTGEVIWNLSQNRLHTVAIALENETEISVAGMSEGVPVGIMLQLTGETKLTVDVD